MLTFCMLCLDDDSEPILGQWFEETLSPEEPPAPSPRPADLTPSTNEAAKSPQRAGNTDSPTFLPDGKDYTQVMAVISVL